MERIDLYYTEKGDYAPREGLPFVKRENIAAIIQYKDKYLFLGWNQVNYQNSLVTGGINSDETREEAVYREVLEETGYFDICDIIPLDGINVSRFYVEHKGENREAFYYPYLVILNSLAQQTISAEETKEHSCFWETKEKLDEVHLFDNHHYMLEKALEKSKIS